MTGDNEHIFRLALASYRNMNVALARSFEACGITPEDFFTKNATTLAAVSGMTKAFFDDGRRAEALEKSRGEYAYLSHTDNLEAIYYTDPRYPERLAFIEDAPLMLFATGKLPANDCKTIAIVGTRHCTAYGADFTRRLVADIADTFDNVAIISGLAYGVDIASHRAAIDAGIPTGAILAHGLNTIYPADHRADAVKIVNHGGFIASEYPSWASIHKGNFLARNRIVAAMSDLTIVVESDIKGGAMSTARLANIYSREVMALPGRINDTYSRGCNDLIARQSAHVIRDVDDIINLMMWPQKEKAGMQQELALEIPPNYLRVIEVITTQGDTSANELCVALNMPYSTLSSLLFQMEMDDYIIALPGGRYALASRTS